MNTPSAESVRRSRSATSSGSPMSTPSTKITPAPMSVAELRLLAVELERDAVVATEDVLRGAPDRLGQLGVQADALVVAVERHHVLRLGQVEHQLHLLPVAVAGSVDRGVLGGDHPSADLEDPVDRLVDRPLVAGDRRRREDDGVAGVQLDVAVLAVGHPPQRRERLALAAGRDRDHLLVGVVLDLPRLDQAARPGRWRSRGSRRC